MKRANRIITEHTQRFTFTRRAMLLGGGQAAVGVVLAGRMAWLSIAENERYRLLAESNRVQLILIPPRRGWIVDRHGRPIANNRTSFRVDLIPEQLRDREPTLAALRQILALDAEEMQRIHDELDKAAHYQPVPVAENIPYDHYAAITVRLADNPGVAPTSGNARYYPAGAAVGHLTGYVGAASPKQYEETRDPLLITPGFKVGKEGLELTMEPVLRGKPGARREEVTARGRLVRDLETRPDVTGGTLHLTIDAGLHQYAARRLGPNSGSVVVLDCLTGDLLAMASMPCYDPNSFSDGISHSEWNMLAADDHLPLVNKVLQGLYPPGSTSKPMTALGLLEAGIDPTTKVNCTGAYRVGNSFFHCSKRGGHGPVDMHRAIALSCDIYFYHSAVVAGINALAPVARKLGLGEEFPLPVASQRYGTVPDPAWMERKYHKSWSTYDTVNTSIGQGYMLVNPLQLAVMTGRIASGRAITPQLIRSAPALATPLDLDPEHLAFVRNAMNSVVNGGGTAGVARLPLADVQLAGKTGTAQVRRITMAERARGVLSNEALPWRFRDHSLFIGFAPVANPRYAAAVIVEHGGWGASVAAPIARDTLTWLYDKTLAMDRLLALEEKWGGDIATRMHKASLAWRASEGAATTNSGQTGETGDL
ncbi:MAG TPA: penicillin-binding protein 2 [Sphingomonadaceae bacterium]|nr:penicillin-binding protein 2 [Sphingomonadaceae bacterium]